MFVLLKGYVPPPCPVPHYTVSSPSLARSSVLPRSAPPEHPSASRDRGRGGKPLFVCLRISVALGFGEVTDFKPRKRPSALPMSSQLTWKGPTSGPCSASTDETDPSTVLWGAAPESQVMEERAEMLPGPFQVSKSMRFPIVTASDQTISIPKTVHREL